MTDRGRDPRRGLRPVRGAAPRQVAGVEIAVGPRERSPFPVDALVVEDDTYSVLGAGTTVREPAEHPIRLWTALQRVVEARPGTVIVRPGRPLRMLAVVHDLAQEPTWTETWIATALAAVVREATRRQLGSLALPPLGAVHGRLPAERFVELLGVALATERPHSLKRIWVVAAAERIAEIERHVAILARRAAGQAGDGRPA